MPVDELSQDFLRVLLENDGEATTTVIRSETGMSRGQVTHRFRKLDDLDWIDIRRADSGKGNRTPPKVAVLNEDGMTAIRSGKAGEKVLGKEPDDEDDIVEVTEEQFDEFKDQVDRLQKQLNVVVDRLSDVENREQSTTNSSATSNSRNNNNTTSSTNSTTDLDEERVEKLEHQVGQLRNTIEMLNKQVSNQNGAASNASDTATNDEDFSEVEALAQELQNEQEYLKEWMTVAQHHIEAIQLFFEKHDVEYEEYLKEVRQEE